MTCYYWTLSNSLIACYQEPRGQYISKGYGFYKLYHLTAMIISHFSFEDPYCTWKSKMEPCNPNLTWSELAHFNSNQAYRYLGRWMIWDSLKDCKLLLQKIDCTLILHVGEVDIIDKPYLTLDGLTLDYHRFSMGYALNPNSLTFNNYPN